MERVDKSAMILLNFCCPGLGETKCKISTGVNWVHKKCNSKIYIDNNGDVYCDKNCSIPKKDRFIQHWKFNCEKTHSAEYSGAPISSDLLSTLQITSQSVTNHHKGDKKLFLPYYKKLANNLTARWEDIDN